MKKISVLKIALYTMCSFHPTRTNKKVNHKYNIWYRWLFDTHIYSNNVKRFCITVLYLSAYILSSITEQTDVVEEYKRYRNTFHKQK